MRRRASRTPSPPAPCSESPHRKRWSDGNRRAVEKWPYVGHGAGANRQRPITCGKIADLAQQIFADHLDVGVCVGFPHPRHNVVHEVERGCNVRVITHLAAENNRLRFARCDGGRKIVQVYAVQPHLDRRLPVAGRRERFERGFIDGRRDEHAVERVDQHGFVATRASQVKAGD